MRNANRSFALMVIGQVVSVFGASILRFALSLYILDQTGRADLFAVILAVSTIPGILLFPMGGAIADRFNRRNLMVAFDLMSSGVVMLYALLLWTGHATLGATIAATTMLFTISSLYQPAVQASIPLLVDSEYLSKANGLVNGVCALSNLAGPILGGVLYSVLGLHALVAFSSVTFFLSAVMEMFIHIPFIKQETEGHIYSTLFKDMKSAVHFITKQKPHILRIMILACGLNMLLSPFFIIGAPYILRVTMGSGDMAYGLGLGLLQISAIIGALLAGAFAVKMSAGHLHHWLTGIALLMIPTALALAPWVLRLGYWPSFLLFFAGAVPIVVTLTLVALSVLTSIQRETPNMLLGKVMALIHASAQCTAPFGQLLYGAVFQAFSTRVYLPAIGVCLFTLLLALAAKWMLRGTAGSLTRVVRVAENQVG